MYQTYKVNTEKYVDTKFDPHIDFLQIKSSPLGLGLPSPAALLFNHPVRGIMLTVNRPPIGVNNNDEHYRVLVKKLTKNYKNHNTSRNYALIPIGSTVAVQ